MIWVAVGALVVVLLSVIFALLKDRNYYRDRYHDQWLAISASKQPIKMQYLTHEEPVRNNGRPVPAR